MLTKKKFLVTLPALNEERIIQENILTVSDYLEKNYNSLLQDGQIKICVAVNGSTDNTEEIVRNLRARIPHLNYSLTKKPGRGRALDNTWGDAPEDVFLYIDSDLAYDLSDLGSMLDSYIMDKNFDMVVASRRVRGSIVKRNLVRKILTEGYNYLIKILFFNSFTDAQAGCKSITKIAYLEIRDKINIYDGWFFDTALLLYVEKNGLKIKDIAITCTDNRRSRMKFVRFVEKYCKGAFEGGKWKAKHAKIKREDLPKILKAIYDARSNYLHNGESMYLSHFMHRADKWDTDITFGMTIDNRQFSASQKLPFTYWFENIVRCCLLNYIKEQICKIDRIET
ncbi:MAG: glycosyltransferase [Patescibacteria group bacterium]|nr:glycosyltransferase [Patescibacteria group bacterium]